jgi:acyl-CoA thioesterase YciA
VDVNAEIFEPAKEGFDLVTRHTVMYPDCNTTNKLFGGRLMMWIDEASGMFVRCHMQRERVVTAHLDRLSFKRPTELGEIIEIYCKVLRFGRTSIKIAVVVTNLDPREPSMRRKKLETQMVWVAIGEDGKPCAYGDGSSAQC